MLTYKNTIQRIREAVHMMKGTSHFHVSDFRVLLLGFVGSSFAPLFVPVPGTRQSLNRLICFEVQYRFAGRWLDSTGPYEIVSGDYPSGTVQTISASTLTQYAYPA